MTGKGGAKKSMEKSLERASASRYFSRQFFASLTPKTFRG
jgi:hypothetical protein